MEDGVSGCFSGNVLKTKIFLAKAVVYVHAAWGRENGLTEVRDLVPHQFDFLSSWFATVEREVIPMAP